MRIKKIVFMILILLIYSTNLFSEIYTFEEHIKNKLQTIKKKYSESNDYEKENLIKERRMLAYNEIKNSFPARGKKIKSPFEINTKNWYDFGEKEAEFSLYLKNKYKIDTSIIYCTESSYFKKEDEDRIVEWSRFIDKLYMDRKTLDFSITKRTKKEYEEQNKKMKKEYDELFNLVKNDIYHNSLSKFPKTCIHTNLEANGLPDSQKKWLEFRKNEAQMYFVLINKDEGMYYGKLFEITKRRTDYLENVIKNIRKSNR